MSLCWPLQMPPTPKAVLISLADNANDQGVCWPSIATISERTCFSERAVQNAIKWLESTGALQADRSNGRHTSYTVTPKTYRQPTQDMHPAGDAPPHQMHHTPAGDAPDPRSRCVGPPQEVPTNRKEPSLEPSRNRQVKARQEFVLPDWVSQKAWSAYLEMRQRIKKPMTPYAMELAVKELGKLRDEGNDVEKVLNQSTLNSWQGLFGIKRNGKSTAGDRHGNFNRQDYAAGVEADGSF